MSLHSSLRSTLGAAGGLRNVLKRYERVRYMMMHGTWTEGRSALGLPKIRQIRMKAKKAEAKEKESGAGAEENAKAPAKPATTKESA